jgi:zinc/manganese transport system permease protein
VDLTTILEFLAAPFVASLILTGIHAYLGVHVVERGVIFVDLSLAQIAALGATIAGAVAVLGWRPHAPVVYWISLAFTFIGAAVFSTIRSRRARFLRRRSSASATPSPRRPRFSR